MAETFPRMVRILDRYLLRELGGPFAIGVGMFTFLLVIEGIYQLADLVITRNVPVLGINATVRAVLSAPATPPSAPTDPGPV